MRNMNTVSEIIIACDGRQSIADAILSEGSEISSDAVRKWESNGIPEKHWRVISSLCGATAEQLHSINEALRDSEAA